MAARIKVSDTNLIDSYERTGNLRKTSDETGVGYKQVHARLFKLGKTNRINVFTDEERDILRDQYVDMANAGRTGELAEAMGRTRSYICGQAKLLGLTDSAKVKDCQRNGSGAALKAWQATNGHPRGFLGKTHSEATREVIAITSQERWDAMSESARDDFIIKHLKAKADKNVGKLPTESQRKAWKSGWREVGGQRCFFRSAWEANYARYLEMLRVDGEIISWEHEPHTFWFEGIKRGTVSYLPDFRVTTADGSVTWHEVKGWMDEKSKTKISRMAKYFPEIALIVVDSKEYTRMKMIYRYIIDGWE